jgi:hypothetical protein
MVKRDFALKRDFLAMILIFVPLNQIRLYSYIMR